MIGHEASQRLASLLVRDGRDEWRETSSGRVTRVDSDGTVWVELLGGSGETPCASTTVDAQPDDVVSVTIEDGRASITGNASSPSVGGTYVRAAVEPVDQKADEAVSEAGRARDAAGSAVADAARAQDAADAAQGSADEAAAAAGSAQASAARASAHADAALDQLGIVQDVVGVLEWASTHGTFVPTSDTQVVEGKVYFTFDGTDYVPVVDPQASELSTYYELSMDEAMTDFVLAHLAVTQRGLWVLPSGVGQAADEQHAAGYKVLLASDGMHVYDGSGALVSSFGTNVDFSAGRRWHIGSDDAYILYAPASGADPASIVIGGSNVRLGSSRTLAEWEAELQQAVDDAADAARTATEYITEVDEATGITVHPASGGGDYVQVDGEGVRIYQDGSLVSSFGRDIRLSSDSAQYIGGDEAYVAWYDSDADGVPDSLTIKGATVEIGADGQTLTERLAEIEGSAEAAVADVVTALDAEASARSEAVGSLSEDLGGVSSSLDALEGRVGTAEGDVAELQGQMADAAADLASMSAYFLFGPDGMTIGKRGEGDASPFSLFLDDQQILFIMTGEDGEATTLAYLGGDAFNAPMMSVDSELRMGSWSWIPREGGNLALKWMGD